MKLIRLAGILGFLAVALGAFGAHALKAHLTPEMADIYHTAVLYHFVHTLALLGYGIWQDRTGGVTWPGWCFGAGIMLFSGSLYGLALTGIKGLGAVTPIGGVWFLAGWVGVMLVVGKKRNIHRNISSLNRPFRG